ncbi:hypothetical protein [Zooshikella ganghwensis]|uniref:hypothetical protein n=1 Tax=Zooshikella ganghwensis TaxID=202772 RepID=UPI0004001D28|nr:hypothetical protein [Zooshikella ganghwensis]
MLYDDLLSFHLARHAVYWVVKQKRWKELWLPHFICPEIINWLNRLPIKLEFYSLTPSFNITPLPRLTDQSGLLWINYFGIYSEYEKTLFNHFSEEQCIIDNCHALFSTPSLKAATIYSPRKFLGVPDGAWLAGNMESQQFKLLPQATSWSTCDYLLKQIDLGSEAAFTDYQAHEKQLGQAPLQQMSQLTKTLLCAIDYSSIQKRREDNFEFWSQHLQSINRIVIPQQTCAALCYPLLVHTPKLKSFLIQNRVYLPTYWPGLDTSVLPSFEKELISKLCCLPVDQRYTEHDLAKIYQLIMEFGL